MKKIKEKVINKLINKKRTRDNDNLLIAELLQELYGTTDMRQVATMTNEGICETITRQRRLAQRQNPLLAPSKNVSKARARQELKFREEMRKEL